ncbi:MAG: flagellar hook capping FlgD N-terminal domain-containing protein [Rhizomicrobium sp.]
MTTSIPPTSGGTSNSGGNAALQQLSGNFDTFLTLLTTQLQNQDPMSPMDSNSFTQELVEFSGVEQQINTNSDLQTLIGQGQSSAGSNAVGYLGKTITITNGNAALQDGNANWTYANATTAANTTLTVSNSSGQVVYTTTGDATSGQHSFAWNGEDANGTTQPDGVYTLAATSTATDGSAVTTAVASSGTVDEVNMTGATPLLMIGPMGVPISSVSAVGSSS